MSLDKIDLQFIQPYAEISDELKHDNLLKVWKALKLSTPTSFIFMSDDDLLEINKSALNHDYYTDVITFDYDDPDIEFNEVLISAERITEHAETYKTSVIHEAYRVCVHGLLHLAGFDDQTMEDKQEMTRLENHYLDLYCST